MSGFKLDEAVASTPDGPGRHLVHLTADWDTPNGTANGGYVLAVVLRAVLDDARLPDPLVASITYFRPPSPGPGLVTVVPLREGRRVCTYQATLEQDGRPVVHAVVSVHDADGTGDQQHTPHAAPAMPPPEECLDLVGQLPAGRIPIVDRYDVRHAAVPGWMEGRPSGVTEATFWVRPEDGRPIDALAAAAIVDGYPPVTTEIGLIASATVQLTVHFRRRPSTGWALAHVVTRHVIDGFHDEDVELWDRDGNLVAQSRQLAILS